MHPRARKMNCGRDWTKNGKEMVGGDDRPPGEYMRFQVNWGCDRPRYIPISKSKERQ